MKTIVLLSQKGGSGKTTLAVHLAVVAQTHNRKVLIIDADPQKSAETWHETRSSDSPKLAVALANEIGELLGLAKKEGIDFAFVDTMPHTSASSSTIAQYADLVVIPCQPTLFDIAAIRSSIDIIKARRKDAVIVINRAPLRAPEIEDTRKALSQYRIEVYPEQITDRRIYFRAVTQGLAVNEFEPKSVASKEIKNLWEWIQGKIQ